MARKLTDKLIRSFKPKDREYKKSDGYGLYILVKPDGSKYWRAKGTPTGGKETTLAYGVYRPGHPNHVSLAKAREKHDKARVLLKTGETPTDARRRENREKLLAAKNSFESIATEWWEKQKGEWSAAHADRVWSSLKLEVFPYIGRLPISEIEAPDVLAVVRRVESRDALDVASRVLQRSSAVFKFAVQTGRAKYNPASELSGVLKTRKVQHRASVDRSELPELLQGIEGYEGDPITRFALKFLMLTFVRPGELRGARWEEFDLDEGMWRVPALRMKMGTEHLVPVSRQAVEVLEELAPHTNRYELLFPGARSKQKPISENTMTYALYRIGFKSRATAHGMRATASSILNEQGFHHDAIERQLAHIERNKVRGAYTHHAEYLKERKRMMQWWADFLDTAKTGSNVIPANFGQRK